MSRRHRRRRRLTSFRVKRERAKVCDRDFLLELPAAVADNL